MENRVILERKTILKFASYCISHEPLLIWREFTGGDFFVDGEVEITRKNENGQTIATGKIFKVLLKATSHLKNGYPIIRIPKRQVEYLRNSNFDVLIITYDIENDKLFARNFKRIQLGKDLSTRSYQVYSIQYFANDEIRDGDNSFIKNHLDEDFIFEQKSKSVTDSFSSRLDSCSCGIDSWKSYENICAGIIDYLFSKSFRNYVRVVQSRSENGLDVKDLVIPNRSELPFWKEIRTDYSARNIVFEFKNYCEPIGKDQLIQISNYLKKKTYGRFAVVFCRKGLSKNGEEEQKELLRDDDKMIIVLSDQEVKDLINIKNSSGSPETILENLKTSIELKI